MVHKQYITPITANTTLDYGYDTYLVDASGGSFTITLPTILADGMFYLLRRTDTSDNVVTVNCSSGQLINGLSSIIVPSNTDMEVDAYNFAWYTPTNKNTYFTAYRGGTGISGNIAIPNTSAGSTGIFVPFPVQGPSGTIYGSWGLTKQLYNGVTGSFITVPIGGRYSVHYVVFFSNNGGTLSYATASSALVVGGTGGTIVPGGGATIQVPGTHIEPLTGVTILDLNTNDIVGIKVIGNTNNLTIPASVGLFAADNTSSTINLMLL